MPVSPQAISPTSIFDVRCLPLIQRIHNEMADGLAKPWSLNLFASPGAFGVLLRQVDYQLCLVPETAIGRREQFPAGTLRFDPLSFRLDAAGNFTSGPARLRVTPPFIAVRMPLTAKPIAQVNIDNVRQAFIAYIESCQGSKPS